MITIRGQCHVVSHDDHLDEVPLGAGTFCGEAEIQPITRVVFDDQNRPGRPVTGADRRKNCVRPGEVNTSPATAALSIPLPT